MRLGGVSASEALARSWVRAGHEVALGSPAHIADELRAHLLALGSAPRASLVRRVVRLLQPICAVDDALVEGTCRALERRGDIIGALHDAESASVRLTMTTEVFRVTS